MKKLFLFSCLFFLTCIGVGMFFLHLANAYNEPFENPLSQFINNNSQNTKHVSVYIYKFKSKETISFNDGYRYMPASLNKLAFMITFYKLAESHPEILEQTLVYQKGAALTLSPNIQPQVTLEPGKTYTINDLINRMIIYSDNDATNLLITAVDDNTLEKTFTDIGLVAPQPQEIDYTISIKDFSKFFIELQNASYLNKKFSQKALDLLKDSQYKEGLVAGVPSTILVADKFGERTVRGAKIANQFHECGIVYYPDNPYLLCVMTDGNDIYQQSRLVKNISQFVYHNISQ